VTLAELRARLQQVETDLREIHEAAGDADLTEEQSTRWTELTAERSRLTADIQTREQREQTVRELAARGATEPVQAPAGPEVMRRVQPWDGTDVRALPAREVRDRALAVLDRDEAEHLDALAKERAARAVRAANENCNGALIAQRLLLTEHEDYREAFMRLVTRANPALTPEQARAVQRFEEWRAMSIGTDSAGGFGVPVLIDPTIILTAQGHPNDILGLARVEVITTDAWKGVTSPGVTWKFRAEATAVTDGSPTLAQPVVTAHRADGYIPYSIEVGMDYPGFAGEMSMLLSEGYSELLVDKLTRGAGDGSDEPFGIETALDANTNVEVATTTAGTISASDVNGLWAALPIRYRNPAARTAWMAHTGVNGVIQELGQEGGSAFTVNFTAEGVTILKGRRMYENDYLDDLPAGTAAGNLLIVGDWRNFLVAQRAGMSIELVPHVFDVTNNRPTGERAWFAWARVGSDSINDLGFRMLQNKTS
jgi:HK97 family phage major capsid protein